MDLCSPVNGMSTSDDAQEQALNGRIEVGSNNVDVTWVGGADVR